MRTVRIAGCFEFGEGCSFEGLANNVISKEIPFIGFDKCGSEQRKLYFFLFKEGIIIRVGCFLGDESRFRAAVNRKDNELEKKSYLAFLEIAIEMRKGLLEKHV